jgi:hypothetical protein
VNLLSGMGIRLTCIRIYKSWQFSASCFFLLSRNSIVLLHHNFIGHCIMQWWDCCTAVYFKFIFLFLKLIHTWVNRLKEKYHIRETCGKLFSMYETMKDAHYETGNSKQTNTFKEIERQFYKINVWCHNRSKDCHSYLEQLTHEFF